MDSGTADFVRRRAGNRCEYCRLHQAALDSRLHIEHVIARQHRGSDDESNLCLACNRCNLHKGPNLAGIDHLTSQIVSLFYPRRDSWPQHFELRGAIIVGLTVKGKVTLDLLQMNSIERKNLRKRLIEEGQIEFLS